MSNRARACASNPIVGSAPIPCPVPARAALRAAGLVLAALLLGAGPPRAAAPAAGADRSCAESVAARVQAHYEGVRDLEARFAQETRSVAFGAAGGNERASGEVVFAKPGRMRWAYTRPEASLVVSDGHTLWIHDPAAREVQVLPVEQGFLSGAAIQFLLGAGQLLESFEVSSDDCAADPVVLVLRPRADATYEHLELAVDPASGAVRRTVVVDLFGNRTEVTFEDVRTNQDPPASLFRFEPPEGTKVLRLEGP